MPFAKLFVLLRRLLKVPHNVNQERGDLMAPHVQADDLLVQIRFTEGIA